MSASKYAGLLGGTGACAHLGQLGVQTSWGQPKPKLCKDCRWYSQDRYGLTSCQRPVLVKDPVNGDHQQPLSKCLRLERAGECGPSGKFWERRPEWVNHSIVAHAKAIHRHSGLTLGLGVACVLTLVVSLVSSPEVIKAGYWWVTVSGGAFSVLLGIVANRHGMKSTRAEEAWEDLSYCRWDKYDGTKLPASRNGVGGELRTGPLPPPPSNTVALQDKPDQGNGQRSGRDGAEVVPSGCKGRLRSKPGSHGGNQGGRRVESESHGRCSDRYSQILAGAGWPENRLTRLMARGASAIARTDGVDLAEEEVRWSE